MPTREAAPTTAASRRRSGTRKKTLLLDQDLLDRARQALGARTETDTVTHALEAVIRREQQVQGRRALAALRSIDLTRVD